MKSKIAILLLFLFSTECIYTQSQIKEMQTLFNLNSQTIEDTTDNIESLDSAMLDQYKYWLTFGFFFFPKAYFSSSYSYHFSLFTYFVKLGAFGRGGIRGPGTDGLLCASYDISIGKRKMTEWFMVSYYLGLAYIKGEIIDNGDTDRFSTIGLQGNLQYVFRLADEIGIGVGGYANLNYFKSYIGAEINFTIGNDK